MDLEKRGSSQLSSEESEQLEQTESPTKRSYECTFCKRGFTNAQALGGHMNIHRKDRAKAKLLNPARAHVPSISRESAKYYPVVEARRAYQACFQAPGPSPSPRIYPQYGYHGSDHFLGARGDVSLQMNEELLGANLSLGIGPAEMEGNNLMKMYMRKEEEIDLELRLGHQP